MQTIGSKYIRSSICKSSRTIGTTSRSSDVAHQDHPERAGEGSRPVRIAASLFPAMALMLLLFSASPSASRAQEYPSVGLNPRSKHISVNVVDRYSAMNPRISSEIAEADPAGTGFFEGAGVPSAPAQAGAQVGPTDPIGNVNGLRCSCACDLTPAPPGPSARIYPRHEISCFWLDGQAANGPLAHDPGKPTLSFVMNSQLYLAGIQKLNPALAAHFFDTERTILFTTNNNVNPVPSGWRSTGGMKFSSFALFNAAVSSGTIDSQVSVVIYDNEKYNNSGQTPSDEQINPASFTTQFENLAHHHCYGFMVTPSRDLVQDQLNYTGGTLDSYYLATGPYQGSGSNFPLWASASSNIYEIQSQVHTIDGQYVSFTTAAAAEAVMSNPSTKIIVGLSTNYGTAQDMYNAVISTYQLPNVVGYFINLKTTAAGYQQVVDFLTLLRNDGF